MLFVVLKARKALGEPDEVSQQDRPVGVKRLARATDAVVKGASNVAVGREIVVAGERKHTVDDLLLATA